MRRLKFRLHRARVTANKLLQGGRVMAPDLQYRRPMRSTESMPGMLVWRMAVDR